MRLLKSLFARFSKWYEAAAVILLNTLILFVGINLLCDAALDFREYLAKQERKKKAPYSFRKYNDSLATVHPHMTETEVNALIAQSGAVTQGYESYTQFKENPYRSRFVNIDPAGFRHIERQAPWPPPRGRFTVFVFGGSTTYGYGIPDDQTIPSHLQGMFREAHGRLVNVYNFGRGAYMSIQERILFEKLLLWGFIPDMAIFIDGLNDLCFFKGEPAYTKKLQELMAEGRVPSMFKLLHVLPVIEALELLVDPESDNRTFKFRLDGAGSLAPMRHPIEEFIQRYKRNKRLTEAAAKEFCVTPVFVWQPVPVYKYDQRHNIFGRFDYDDYMPALRAGYQLLAKEAQSGGLGTNFIWSADIQEPLKKPLYVDAIHYSPEMARFFAQHIFDNMQHRGLLAHIHDVDDGVGRSERCATSSATTPDYAGPGSLDAKIHAMRYDQ